MRWTDGTSVLELYNRTRTNDYNSHCFNKRLPHELFMHGKTSIGQHKENINYGNG